MSQFNYIAPLHGPPISNVFPFQKHDQLIGRLDQILIQPYLGSSTSRKFDEGTRFNNGAN